MKPSDVLRELQTYPKKQFGQNFLTDEQVLTDIVAAGSVESTDTVVEIGPGLGVLTEALCQRAQRVIAVEADRDLAEYVRDRRLPNVTVVTGDALQVDWTATIDGDYKLIANIPYSITSPLLRQIFHLPKKPSLIVLLIQKEVAERLMAQPGSNDRGFLTLIAEANAQIELVRLVSPGSFYPSPKVDSAVVKIKLIASRAEEIFWPAVEAGFRHKRQTLANSLKDVMITKEQSAKMFDELGLNPMARPDDLTFEDWKNLSESIQKTRNQA